MIDLAVPAEKAFLIARSVAPLKVRGLEAVRALPGRELERLLLGAAKLVDPAHGFSGEEERDVRHFQKGLAKALTPELERTLRPLLEEIWRGRAALPVEDLKRGVQLTASRCGLLAAGGVWPAARAIVKTNVALRGRIPERTEDVVREFKEVGELRDLLSFSVSEGYLETRRALGLDERK